MVVWTYLSHYSCVSSAHIHFSHYPISAHLFPVWLSGPTSLITPVCLLHTFTSLIIPFCSSLPVWLSGPTSHYSCVSSAHIHFSHYPISAHLFPVWLLDLPLYYSCVSSAHIHFSHYPISAHLFPVWLSGPTFSLLLCVFCTHSLLSLSHLAHLFPWLSGPTSLITPVCLLHTFTSLIIPSLLISSRYGCLDLPLSLLLCVFCTHSLLSLSHLCSSLPGMVVWTYLSHYSCVSSAHIHFSHYPISAHLFPVWLSGPTSLITPVCLLTHSFSQSHLVSFFIPFTLCVFVRAEVYVLPLTCTIHQCGSLEPPYPGVFCVCCHSCTPVQGHFLLCFCLRTRFGAEVRALMMGVTGCSGWRLWSVVFRAMECKLNEC
ncbi:hypothetical protein J6590_103588, partial [Homalodisca vitripennis]